MNYILTMSLSGSLMCAAALAVKRLWGGRMPEKVLFWMWKLVILFYLVPLPFLKMLYSKLLMIMRTDGSRPVCYRAEDMILFLGQGRIAVNETVKRQAGVFIAWISLAAVFGLLLLGLYLRQRKRLLSCMFVEETDAEQKNMEALKEAYGIQNRVSVKKCGIPMTPFTMGVYRPVVFYADGYSPEEKSLILEHEFQHVKSRDTLWKLLSQMAAVLHFFNPAAWLARRELNRACEYACDERVIRGKSEEARILYASLLAKSGMKRKNSIWGVSLLKNSREKKIRILKILEYKKKDVKAANIFLIAAMALIGSLTVFAYKDVKIARGEETMMAMYLENGLFEFYSEDIPAARSPFRTKTDEQPSYVVTVIYGPEADVGADEAAGVRTLCEHSYEQGSAYKYFPAEDGRCFIHEYEAQRCVYCGNITLRRETGCLLHTEDI